MRDLEVRKYYIANDSVDRHHWPALRVKALTESRGAAQFRDEEVLPGVEDLQVEFGVRDPEDRAGPAEFRRPGFPGLAQPHRWLRYACGCEFAPIAPRAGYFDARPLQYADVDFVPDARESRQRRLLVQRTVALRNLRPP